MILKYKIYKRKVFFTALLFVLSLLWSTSLSAERRKQYINVFAAASLSGALYEIAEVFDKRYGVKVNLNLAGSNTLRMQIEKGSPCDVFISANADNTRTLAKQGYIEPDQISVLLTNRLVVVAEKSNQEVFQNFDEILLRAKPYLSLPDPETVPAGIYAKEALVNAGLWIYIKDRIVPAVDVRAALSQIEMGNINYGIVYMTDASISDKVIQSVYTIPEKYHSPIQYLSCLIRGREHKEAGKLFYEFLKRMETRNIFQKYGFTVL